MSEVWKPIPGFDGYEASDQGNVRSYRRQGGGEFHKIPHPLRPSIMPPGGYAGVGLRQNGRVHRRRIANLVLLAFVGPPPDDCEVCHNNSISTDNRLENLRYDTHENNMRDCCPLSAAQVIEIRNLRAAGEGIRLLAKSFGISYGQAKDLCNGRTFTNIGGLFTKNKHRRSLTIAEVVSIRERYAEGGVTLKAIGKEYGLDESAISRICSGYTYEDDGGPLVRNFHLTAAQVVSIREEYASGNVALGDICDEYDRSASTIWCICRGKYYKNYGGPLTTD